jgi:hypothetical protein
MSSPIDPITPVNNLPSEAAVTAELRNGPLVTPAAEPVDLCPFETLGGERTWSDFHAEPVLS